MNLRLRAADKTGFTLAELLVTISIIAITATMATYLVKSYEPDIRLYTASRDLKSQLERARSLTLTSQANHGILFDTNNEIYELVNLSGGITVLETFQLADLIDYYSVGPFTGNLVAFNAAGAASEAGNIVLTNQNGLTKTVQVKPSGYISIGN